MAKKKGKTKQPWVVGRIDGKELPSGYFYKHLSTKERAEQYAQATLDVFTREGVVIDLYIDGPNVDRIFMVNEEEEKLVRKGQYIVGRVDGEKLPSGFRRKRFYKEHDAKVYITLRTAQEGAKGQMPPDGYYVDGPNAPKRVFQKKANGKPTKMPKQRVPMCQYIDVRSATRVDVVHHVYTGDSVNGFHCTCEAFHYGSRECDVLFTCVHIDEVVFGKGV